MRLGTRVVWTMARRIFLSVTDVERSFQPFSEMVPCDAGMMSSRVFMAQTSGVNPSLYTNYKKPKPTKKPKKGC